MTTTARISRWVYPTVIRPLLFHFNPEHVHTAVARLGEGAGRLPLARTIASAALRRPNPMTAQKLWGVDFVTPFGLAAGFDYEARLTELLPSLGFGFQTVGTITHQPCAGNASPRLGRLVQSRSLMVNKGFRNPGINTIVAKLGTRTFSGPVGLSIGQTNVVTIHSVETAIEDIRATFRIAEGSAIPFAYYELNVSCPNLKAGFSLYESRALDALLRAVTAFKLRPPLLIKMPISVSDHEFRAMLGVIQRHPVQGIIVGNLQKDRTNPSLNRQELAKFPVGNFSGRPTQERSNALIRLAYQATGGKLRIIGCGGVFNAQDAYQKIRSGASLIQLITGLIFEGPQLVSAMNSELAELLAKDGYTHLRDAVGADVGM